MSAISPTSEYRNWVKGGSPGRSTDASAGWLPAPFGEAERAAKATIDEMQAEAAECYGTAPEESKQLMKEVLRSSRAANVRAMIDMAKSENWLTLTLTRW
jgi:hypothetical protein